jgi:PAS domain S-box-containing protein
MQKKDDIMADRYKPIIESVNGIIWEAAPGSFGFTFVSDSVTRILGYDPHQLVADKSVWINCIYKEDRDRVVEYYLQAASLENHTLEFRVVAADGNIRWMKNYVSIIKDDVAPAALCGVMMDITKSKQLELLERLEKDVLEQVAEPGSDIDSVLPFYVTGLERIFPAMQCSVLRIMNGYAYNWASPSLPADYVKAINGVAIGPKAGSCGTAAYLRKRIIVSDIEHDDKWATWKELALSFGLRACWSEPIIGADGLVLATFAIYYPSVKMPGAQELEIIARSASLLRVIIENKQYAATITEMNNMAEQAQALANFGTWQWDFKDDNPRWSDSLYKILGLDPNQFKPSYENYRARLHPDDAARVTALMNAARENKTDITFDERIIKPNGCIRHLRSWFRVIVDERGEPSKFIGASLDITDAKETEQRMENIAWQQSHVIRAPLARIMGLVNLLKDDMEESEADRKKLYDLILSSANELDGVIRNITYHTQKKG